MSPVAAGNRVARILLWLMAASAVVVGAWAEFTPRSFYDDFPGGGRHWVSVDGPFNEHLVRDVGALNLALAVVTIAAAIAFTTWLVRATALASLAYSVPHLIYHIRHLDHYGTADKVGNVASLGLAALLPLLVLVLYRPPPDTRR